LKVSAALDQLEEAFDDLEVNRANMQHNIDQFLETQRIYDRVQEDGPSILPITVVDGEIVAEGEYLSYDELTAAIDETVTHPGGLTNDTDTAVGDERACGLSNRAATTPSSSSSAGKAASARVR